MRRSRRPTALAAFLLTLLATPASSQEDAEPAPAAESPAPAKPKPRPKPKPKPKPAPKAEQQPEPKNEPAAKEAVKEEPAAATARPSPTPEPPAKAEAPAEPSSPSPSQGAFAAPSVACDPGKSVLYEGPKDVSLWVTRTGTVTVDNPLRPLTPDVTRVLQLVVAGKLATAYGADLNAMRRGGTPAALESALGGPIRWDKALGTLPDTLNIVADSGATIVEPRFRECGDAPAAKALPVAKGKKDDKAKQARKASSAGSPESAAATPKSLPPATAGAVPQTGAPEPPRKLNLPQGAIQ